MLEGHNVSGHSQEDVGDLGAGRIVTQVQNTSPVRVDQAEQLPKIPDQVSCNKLFGFCPKKFK